jgi:hypothetical protein
MVVPESRSSSWVCHPSRRATETKGNSCGNKHAQEMEPARNNHAVVEWQDGVAREHVGRWIALLADLPRQRQGGYPLGEAAGDGDGHVPIGHDRLGTTLLAVLCHERRIDEVPLGLQGTPEDGVAGLVGDGFEVVQGRGGLEGGEVRGGQIEGGEFDHLLGGGIVHAADQHANMADRMLLWQLVACILPHLRAIRVHVLLMP